MKTILSALTFLFASSPIFAQQFLWSTAIDNKTRHVHKDSVVSEVLKFYNRFEYYFEVTGYTKSGFVEDYQSPRSSKKSVKSQWTEIKKKVGEVQSPTVLAVRQDAEVYVISANKHYVEMFIFSNDYEYDMDAILTYDSEKKNFSKWFKTFIY